VSRSTRPGTVGPVARVALLLLATCVPAGCVSEPPRRVDGPATVTTRTKPHRTAPTVKQTPRGVPSGERPDDPTDPCAVRMHDLSGLLLLYYAVNKHLPDRVEELAPLADPDVTFDPTCPLSGRPYVYAPGGLQSSEGGERYLVLYDAAPSHGGLRWGVFVAPPQAGKPPATWVILMSEQVFRGYVPRVNDSR